MKSIRTIGRTFAAMVSIMWYVVTGALLGMALDRPQPGRDKVAVMASAGLGAWLVLGVLPALAGVTGTLAPISAEIISWTGVSYLVGALGVVAGGLTTVYKIAYGRDWTDGIGAAAGTTIGALFAFLVIPALLAPAATLGATPELIEDARLLIRGFIA